MRKPLTCDINRRIYMTDGQSHRGPESRATQPGAHAAAPTRAPARGRRTPRPDLFPLPAPSLPLPRAGPAAQTSGSGRRCQSVLHGETLAQSGRETPHARRCDRIDAERDRQPRLTGAAAPRGRAWLTGRQLGRGSYGWNIDLIGCWRRSWRRLMNCSCPTKCGPHPEPAGRSPTRRF